MTGRTDQADVECCPTTHSEKKGKGGCLREGGTAKIAMGGREINASQSPIVMILTHIPDNKQPTQNITISLLTDDR